MAIDSKKPPPAQQPTYGPYLQFLGFENEDAQWLGSILLVASFEHPPLLVFQDGDLQPYSMNPILLDTFGNYRYNPENPMLVSAQCRHSQPLSSH